MPNDCGVKRWENDTDAHQPSGHLEAPRPFPLYGPHFLLQKGDFERDWPFCDSVFAPSFDCWDVPDQNGGNTPAFLAGDFEVLGEGSVLLELLKPQFEETEKNLFFLKNAFISS